MSIKLEDARLATLKWMARMVGCYLLGFSTTYASGWISTTQPDAPNAELCRA